jgi:hypothetical protein
VQALVLTLQEGEESKGERGNKGGRTNREAAKEASKLKEDESENR